MPSPLRVTLLAPPSTMGALQLYVPALTSIVVPEAMIAFRSVTKFALEVTAPVAALRAL